jgi:acyl-coenzyme A synthetase/AMP-(fatty) acid ligase
MRVDNACLPPGYREIPSRVNIAREVLDRQVEKGLGSQTALVHQAGNVTYSDLRSQVDRLARALLRLGVSRGTRVLIQMPNCPECAVSFLALTKIGAPPVPIKSPLGREEVSYVVEHSGAEAAVTLGSMAQPLRSLRANFIKGHIVARGSGSELTTAGETSFEDLLAGEGDEPMEAADTGADDPAFFVYTSGTTERHLSRPPLDRRPRRRESPPPSAGTARRSHGHG